MIRNAPRSGATGGRGSAPAHPVARRALLPLALILLATGLGGCSTKADIRDVRADVNRLQTRQDSIYRLLRSQNEQLMEALTGTTERLLNVRGDLTSQMTRLQDQLAQLSELTSQVQIRLNQLDQELTDALREGPISGEPATGGQPTTDGGGADDAAPRLIYEAGIEQVNRGNADTARRAFQMVVDSFPSHEVAPESQRQIGETFAMEGRYDEALRALERVVERYQDSDAAPRALYRAGVIAQERGQAERAREYFRRVISGYPNSDARRLAEEALERIR